MRRIIRPRKQFETQNRIRIHPFANYYPCIDIFHKYREERNSQITNFWEPNEFDDIIIREQGVAVYGINKLFFPTCDFLFINGIYKYIEQEGLIEFFPYREEKINHYQVQMKIANFLTLHKTSLDFCYAFQDIEQDTDDIYNPIRRNRRMFNAKITKYDFLKDIDVSGGICIDRELWASTEVKKHDYFISATFRNVKRKPIDIIIQPSVFTYKVDDDDSRKNAQYRTRITYRYKFKEVQQGLSREFTYLDIPVSHDIAIDGMDDFENFKVGIRLTSKILIGDKLAGSPILFSIGYDYQRFYKLHKDLHMFVVKLSVAF